MYIDVWTQETIKLGHLIEKKKSGNVYLFSRVCTKMYLYRFYENMYRPTLPLILTLH